MNYNSGTNHTLENKDKTKLIDRITIGFVFLFVVTLTNSIFLCQIGYFGALLMMVIRWFITRENKFEKTGMEIPFLVFLLAELISAIFSIDHPHAFIIFFKRLVLIPIIYVIVASADGDLERVKSFFKFYIAAALITIVLYIVFAYEHFISQLYQLEARGPSPFQYVMTAGGLMSFSVIILFAFLVNEKTKLKFRFLILAAFLIASIALFASYTRAAWIGAAAGILCVLILKRQWILLSAGLVVLVFAIFFSKNYSYVYKYKLRNDSLVQLSKFSTNGRANNIYNSGDTLIVADYENGISVRVDDKEVQNIKTVAPITDFRKWKDNFYIGFLVDSRILLIEKKDDGSYKVVNEFTSPGNTNDYKIYNNKFYVQDVDSGLTIFSNPINLKDKITLKEFSGIKNFAVDSVHYTGFDPIKNSLVVYSVNNGIPNIRLDSVKTNSKVGYCWLNGNMIYFQGENGFHDFKIDGNSLSKIGTVHLYGIFKLFINDKDIWACGTDGKFYKINSDSLGKLTYKIVGELGFVPMKFYMESDSLYITQIIQSRLASVVDIYHDTNLERLQQWKTGWKILMDHPFFGVGDIDLKNVYSQYKDYYLKENFGHLHNNYVQFLVILGFVGFAAVMFMLFSIFKLNLKIYKAVKDIDFVSSFSLGALAAFVGFLVSGLAEWNFGDQEIITMVWFTLGLNIAFYKSVLKNKN